MGASGMEVAVRVRMDRAGGRESAARPLRRAGWLALVISIVLVAPAGAMRRCGDDVDGRGTSVPCACGDILVSSRTLTAADRVTHEPCPGNGVVVAADGRVTLALSSRTLRGSGHGVGVLVLRGTLDLTGPGTIQGFETGVLARGAAALAEIVGVHAVDNRLDGVFAEADGYAIQGSIAEGNGRDGFAAGGNAFALDGNRAVGNHRYGISIWGMGAHVGGGLGNDASANGMAGFYVRGMMHDIVGATAIENGGDGVFAGVMHALFSGTYAAHNVRDGLHVMGMGLAFQGNTADDDLGYGVWVMGMDVDDRGGNAGSGNAGLTGLAGTPSVRESQSSPALVQCRMGMTTGCR
jgi:hypothetical protein